MGDSPTCRRIRRRVLLCGLDLTESRLACNFDSEAQVWRANQVVHDEFRRRGGLAAQCYAAKEVTLARGIVPRVCRGDIARCGPDVEEGTSGAGNIVASRSVKLELASVRVGGDVSEGDQCVDFVVAIGILSGDGVLGVAVGSVWRGFLDRCDEAGIFCCASSWNKVSRRGQGAGEGQKRGTTG